VASNGKTLYASQCSSCHGPAAAGGSNVLTGANSAITILSAINRNLGRMGTLSSLTQQNLADIAAFLATPNM
jgi:mono/diheme cytochrome c family protein